MDDLVSLLRILTVSRMFVFPLYPSHLSAAQIRALALRVLPVRVSNHIATIFLSNVVPTAIPPPTHIQCFSNCFTIHPMPDKINWDKTYQQDPETNLIILNAPLDQAIILKLWTRYHTAITRNQIWFLGGRLVYYEHISFANKYICRIVVPSSLRHKIFSPIHAIAVSGHMY